MIDKEAQAEDWVRRGIGGAKNAPAAFKCFYSTSTAGEYECGVVLANAGGGNVDVHIYSLPSFWMKPKHVIKLWQDTFFFCFNVLNCKRVTALIRRDNEPALKFASGMGFQYEGTMRHAADNGVDVSIFGMTVEDYHCHRWCSVDQRTNTSNSKF